MSDTIDRQGAIRIVDSIDTWQAGWRDNAIESLKAMPSAQPERTGRWIRDGYDHPHGVEWCHCSNCGNRESVDSVYTQTDVYPYCAKCGCRMMNEQSIDDKVSELPSEAYYNKNWKSGDGGES